MQLDHGSIGITHVTTALLDPHGRTRHVACMWSSSRPASHSESVEAERVGDGRDVGGAVGDAPSAMSIRLAVAGPVIRDCVGAGGRVNW